jgi:hypothetical protein
MPVTAKLSRLFYQRFGEQIANELVDWFNAVDATYRADLRELPQEQDREQQEGPAIGDVTGGGGEADQRRQRAGDGTDHGVE